MGEISEKISSRPDLRETFSPSSMRRWAFSCHASLPTSHAKLEVWRSRSCGTSRGSEILAKESRGGAAGCSVLVRACLLLLREAAKRGPSEGSWANQVLSTNHSPAVRAGWKHLRADAKGDTNAESTQTQPGQIAREPWGLAETP